MAVNHILELKVKKSIKDLDTLIKVIYASEENTGKYKEISGFIAGILDLLSSAAPNKEAVEEACGKLKDFVQEYNDSDENLDVKKTAGQFASRVATIDSEEYDEFLAMLRSEDKDGLLKHFVEAPASIEIVDVSFCNTDADSNIIEGYGSPLYSDTEYLKPRIRYRVITPGPSIDIWYKIFTPGGTLVYGDAKPGFSWKGTIDRDEKKVYNTALGGFGNADKDCYAECGTWTIEFYEGSRMLYSTTFNIGKRVAVEKKTSDRYNKPLPPPPPQPKPQPRPTPTPMPAHNGSLWQRFKDKIESIGDWFADDESDEKIATVFYVIALLIYVVSVISVWVDDGFISALIAGVIGFFILGIAYYAITIVCMILKWICRIIFYNVWTFLLFLLLLLL